MHDPIPPDYDDELWRLAAAEATRDRAKAVFVAHLVSLATGVVPDAIFAAPRGPGGRGARARAIALYLTHVAFAMPQRRVAAAFQRDPSTVGQAVMRVEALREEGAFDDL